MLLNDLRGEDARRFKKLVRLEGNSDLSLVLRVEGRQLGFLVLRAAGEGLFSKEHADLLATRTSGTGSTCSRSSSRPCGSGATTSRRWSATSSR
jgi:hypothetical protein